MSAILRRAARRDANEPAIIQAYRELGCMVVPLSIENVPDLLVGYLGRWHLDEVKFETAQLTPGQQAWHDEAAKHGERPTVTRTEAHARKNVKLWTLEFAKEAAK